MKGLAVPGGVYSHIAGIDLVRDGQGRYCVLEDNLRTPSGVSYMLEDRKVMMQLFPELFDSHRIAPVDHYPDLLLNSLRETAPVGLSNPSVVLLTPGRATARTLSTPSFPSRWASSWSRAPTCTCRMIVSGCRQRVARSVST
jgi:uncharacterized circularly permuted ATP-grasp superfamily protein